MKLKTLKTVVYQTIKRVYNKFSNKNTMIAITVNSVKTNKNEKVMK